MPARTGVAEIRFTEPELTLIGSVQAANEKELRLGFAAPPPAREHLPGRTADLVLVRDATIYSASARIASATNCELVVAIDGPIHRIYRRAAPRFAFAVPVAFRVLRASGLTGAWQTCTSTDISIGGICIRTDHPLASSDRLEVRFVLPSDQRSPEPSNRPDAGYKAPPDAHVEERAVRARARVANRHVASDGSCRLGLQLAFSDPRDQLRVIRLVEQLRGPDEPER